MSYADLMQLADRVPGSWIVKRPGDVPVVTLGGVEVCNETGGFDVWNAGHLVATDVSEEVALSYLHNNQGAETK